MKAIASAALLSGTLMLSAVTASAAPRVERSGRVYHIAVCSNATGPGVAHCHANLVTDSVGAPHRLATDIRGRPLASPNSSPPPYYLPSQVRAAYNITGVGRPSTLVAIVDAFAYPNAEADLAQFRAFAGLAPCTHANGCLRIVNQAGGTGIPYAADSGWDVEQAADLDTVSTMCPNCRIVLVEARTPSYRDLAQAVDTGAHLGAHVISNSYGGGEVGSQPFESAYNKPGVAVTASTGDSGFAAGPQFPATSPHVIAVGGTTLNFNGVTRTESVWAGSGSGCSTVYAEPSWQTASHAKMSNNTLCTMRMEADVSADADPNTGVIFYMNIPPYAPGLYIVGGTSISNQIIAGIYGERDDPVAYARNPYLAAPSALYDVTTGSNDPCGGTYFCTGVAGYDGPTGLGTPNGDTAF